MNRRKRTVMYLMLLSMSFSILGGGISSQARKKNISLNQKKLTLQVGQRKKFKVKFPDTKGHREDIGKGCGEQSGFWLVWQIIVSCS